MFYRIKKASDLLFQKLENSLRLKYTVINHNCDA